MEISMNDIISALLPCAAFLALLSIVYVSWRNGISPMPASAPVRRAVAKEINRLPGSGMIVEAGSGWGTLAMYLARHCYGRQLVGIENSPVPLGVARFTARFASWLQSSAFDNSRLTYIHGDLYAYPYEGADVIIFYLYPGAMKRLSGIVGKQLTPGVRVISICFAIPGWQHERIIICGDLYRTKIYIYSAEGANLHTSN